MIFGPKKERPEIDRAYLADAVGKIIADYDKFVVNNPGFEVIRDEKRLPHDKETIVMAFCFAIATQDNTNEMRSSLAERALSLAYFQKDVGDNDLHPLGFAVAQTDVWTGENTVALKTSDPAGKEKFEELLPAVQADIARIDQRTKSAVSLRARTRNGNAKP